MPNIADLFASIPGLKADFKTDWREDAKADWKLDWDAVAGGEPAVAPVCTVAPILSGSPVVGETLSITTGTWTGNPAPTFTYQWYVDGSPVSGEVSNTYVIQPGDETFMVNCSVTGTNVAGSDAVSPAPVGPVTAV